MRRNTVKLISLSIKELYGCYDYEVPFNEDVTLLFGENGCGKTTILNIIECIITGQLYRLFDYEYDSIILKYAESTDKDDVKEISVSSTQLGLKVKISENEKSSEIKNVPHMYYRGSTADYYFTKYKILREISNIFNYVSLPLNRVDRSIQIKKYYPDENDRFTDSASFRFASENKFKTDALDSVIELIRRNYTEISSRLDILNKDFQNKIIKSLIDIRGVYDINDLLHDFLPEYDTEDKLKRFKQEYLDLLKEFNGLSQSDEQKYNDYFLSLSTMILQDNKALKNEIIIEAVFKMLEITKMKSALDLKRDLDVKRKVIRTPLDLFLRTINEFINNQEDEKRIEIDESGEIYLTTKYEKHIDIHAISSGERQLVIFFAKLIFDIDRESSGIFMVDEPELSLHLYWQKIFIDKIREVNPNIQIIFATHAPEIVGRHRDKMRRLIKVYSKAEK